MRALLVGALVVTACANDVGSVTTTSSEESTTSSSATTSPTMTAELATGDLSPEAAEAVDRVLAHLFTTSWEVEAVWDLVESGDIRVGWLIGDLLRFYQGGPIRDELVAAFRELSGIPEDPRTVDFVWAQNHLISQDVPAWDDYPEAKEQVLGLLSPLWKQFFDDNRYLDWRLVTWGGVLADERPLGEGGPCNCIPALDYPATTDAAGGDWYADDRIVFGMVVNDEALALPKHQMEVHEMINLTLGGRELGVPYCTLCGSAQAYYVDNLPGVDRVVLRTSGLLQRSNKLMYDQVTGSAIDTFTGRALTGPLAENDVVLEQVSVVATTWRDWKTAHPDTRILAEDGGIGRVYSDDPLAGRDDSGPIFPIGDVDPRLGVQEHVVGVIGPEGTPIAFPVEATKRALAGGDIDYMGITVTLEDGIRVYDSSGEELVSHQSFWFAWSQFHPETLLWSP